MVCSHSTSAPDPAWDVEVDEVPAVVVEVEVDEDVEVELGVGAGVVVEAGMVVVVEVVVSGGDGAIESTGAAATSPTWRSAELSAAQAIPEVRTTDTTQVMIRSGLRTP